MSRQRRAESLARRGAVALAGQHSALRAAGKVSPAEEIGTASSSNSGVPLIFLSPALL